MDFIFNELSFRNVSPDIHSGKSNMKSLLQVCKLGRELGMQRLAVRFDFHEQLLFAGYSINDWLNDPAVSKIFKDLLLGILRHPYIDERHTFIEERFVSSYAFMVDAAKTPVEGLAIAYLYATIAISLQSADEWNVNEIKLLFSEGDYENQTIKVYHASQPNHLDVHKDWITSRIGIKLPITELNSNEKEINLRDDHGKKELLGFSRKLIRSQYVTKVINSLPFNPHDHDFVKQYYDDGKVEIVLVGFDEGFGIVVQTTGRNLSETKTIAQILNDEYHDKY
jgi:hypothetical protein